MQKAWFITGASTGLGREYALAALRRGDLVAATSIDPENMQDYTEEFGDNAFVTHLDVTDHEEVKKVFAQAVERFGKIDVCINNAGFIQLGAIEEMSEAEVRRIFECNFFGTLFVTQEAVAHMRKRRCGTIFQTSSIGGFDAIPGEGIYSATKHAIRGMSIALRREVEALGIRVVIIEPGVIKTPIAKSAKFCEKNIPDYEEVLRADLSRWKSGDHGSEAGDPRKCAEIIMKIEEMDNPPQEILLGSFAFKIFDEVTQSRIEEANATRELGCSADA